MTIIDDNLKLIEGTNQSYGKLYANDSKELHYVDSNGNDLNLSESGDFVSNTTFIENKNAQNQINHAVIQALDGYAIAGSSVQQVYTITAAIDKSASDTFATYTIPANTLNVGSTITVLTSGQVTSYSSGTAFFRVIIGSFLISDCETSTPANGWQFYGHGSATIYGTGSSGSIARGGIGSFGPQSTRSNTATCPVLINGINTIDTTSGIDISVVCEIIGTATLELRQFMVVIS